MFVSGRRGSAWKKPVSATFVYNYFWEIAMMTLGDMRQNTG